MSIKLTTIAAAAIAIIGSSANADSFISYQKSLDEDTVLELGTVSSVGDGVIEIYDYHGGRVGALLGSEQIHAGPNANVRVNVNFRPNFDVIAILKVDGQIVVTRDYDIR